MRNPRAPRNVAMSEIEIAADEVDRQREWKRVSDNALPTDEGLASRVTRLRTSRA